jgi:DtxR family manganese transport transcriptional regulator
MNNPPSFADRHRRTRRDHAAETAEDYVKAIYRMQRAQGRCRVTDLARLFGVSHVTVTKIISRLKREQLVESEPYGPITLTVIGRQLAVKSQRQHGVVFEFLRAIGVRDDIAAVDAEGIEHHVSRQTLACLRRLKEQLEQKGSQSEPVDQHRKTISEIRQPVNSLRTSTRRKAG